MKPVTFAAILAVAGCKSEPAPAPPLPTTDGMLLISSGVMPRRELRYRFTKGTRTPVELAMNFDAKAGAMHRVMPTMVVGMTIAIGEVLADGSAKLRTEVVAGTARPRAGATNLELMSAQSAQLVGLVMTGTLSPRGQVSETKVEATGRDLAAYVSADGGTLTQSLQQVAMPLPDAAVGLGAVWRYRKTMKLNGIDVTSVTTVILGAIEGDRLSFTTISELTGADQSITQNGLAVDVKGVSGFQTSKGVVDLSRASMTGERVFELRASMSRDGQTTPVKVEATTRLAPFDPDAPAIASGSGSGSAATGDAGAPEPAADDQDASGHGAPAADSATADGARAKPAPKKKRGKRSRRKRRPRKQPAEPDGADPLPAPGTASPPPGDQGAQSSP